jgi:ATP-binding cassette, subfamily G (WHITE), member 2
MAEAASISSRSSGEDTGMLALRSAKSQVDVEQQAVAEAHLINRTVRNFSFKGVTVTVKDRETKQEKNIVDNVEGFVEAGTCFG